MIKSWVAMLLAACLLLQALPAAGTGLQLRPIAVPGQAHGSVLAGGKGFILTWLEREAAETALRFAEVDRQGDVLRRGEIARGKDWFVNWADFPALSVAENGDWLAFLLRRSDPTVPYAYDILLTRSQDAGETWSTPALLHDDGTRTEHGFVSLLPDGDDRVLVTWLDGRQGAAGGGEGHDHHGGAITALYAAVSTREGVVETQRLDALTCDCCRTASARGPDGPVVVYRGRSPEEVRDIHAVERIAGTWTTPRRVVADNWTMHGCPVNGPALANSGGELSVAWPTLIDDSFRLRLARRDDGNWRLQAELETHPELAGRVDLAPWGEDELLATWLGVAGNTPVLRLARLDRRGDVLEAHIAATLPPGRMTGMPRLASNGKQALLLWTEPVAGGSRIQAVLVQGKP